MFEVYRCRCIETKTPHADARGVNRRLFAAVPQASAPSGFFICAVIEVSIANLE